MSYEKLNPGLFHTENHCRVCDSDHLINLLHFGDQPLANSLKENPNAPEKKFPLTLAFCEQSSLLQLRETVKKENLFSNYVWVTGTSPSTRNFAKRFFENISNVIQLDRGDFITEIGSNDGTFLKPFIEMGYPNVLGIDPAENIAEMAQSSGVRTWPEFWNNTVSQKVTSHYGYAKVVFARNVIPHVSDLYDVMAGIEHVLGDDGVGAIEFHYARNILEGLQYDAIYHEHLCYFSLKSFQQLLRSFNLFPFHVDPSPISGGALVVYFSKTKRTESERYSTFLREEDTLGVNSISRWQEFSQECVLHRENTLRILNDISNKKNIGFGASARSSTFLNYCGINQNHLQGIIDNNPLKLGKYAPGSSIPIVSFEAGMGMDPDYIFILAWNFKDEIIHRCKENGFKGKYIVAFPNEPNVIP